MKKILSVLLVLVMSISLIATFSACGEEPSEDTNDVNASTNTDNANVEVNFDEKYDEAISFMNSGKYEEAFFAYEELQKIQDRTEDAKERIYSAATAYLEDGKYTEAFLSFRSVYGYKDSAKQLLHLKVVYDKKTDSSASYGYKIYDANGNLVREEKKNGSGEYIQYYYDDAGRLIGSEETGGQRAEVTYIYDGPYVEEFTYWRASDNKFYTVYTYDEHGKLIKEDYTGKSQSTVKEYTYNENGKCIKITRNWDVLEFTYDEYSRLVEYIYDGEISTKFVYNEYGDQIKTLSYKNGEVGSTYEHTFDVFGNEIKNDYGQSFTYEGIRVIYSENEIAKENEFIARF